MKHEENDKELKGLRKAGIATIGDGACGRHLCQFYQPKEDLTHILAPYFAGPLDE